MPRVFSILFMWGHGVEICFVRYTMIPLEYQVLVLIAEMIEAFTKASLLFYVLDIERLYSIISFCQIIKLILGMKSRFIMILLDLLAAMLKWTSTVFHKISDGEFPGILFSWMSDYKSFYTLAMNCFVMEHLPAPPGLNFLLITSILKFNTTGSTILLWRLKTQIFSIPLKLKRSFFI